MNVNIKPLPPTSTDSAMLLTSTSFGAAVFD